MMFRVLGLVAALTLASHGGVVSAGEGKPRADDFAPCADAGAEAALAGSLCARFKAPLRYDDPALGQVELFVRKFPAEGRSKGQVWLIAGGPGESGASYYPLLGTLRAAFPGYDLLAPDHRGTGFSSRLCEAEEAAGSPGGFELEGAEWATCFELLGAKGPRAQAFTISNAARDLNGLMTRYRGRGRTVVYGVSYGTQLVLRTMVVAPPKRLNLIVLDSLVPPETTTQWDLSRRSAVVDMVGRRVLADCDARPECRERLGGSAVAAVEAIEADPKLAALFPGGRPKMFLGALLNSPATRSMIPEVIAGVRAGDLAPIERAKGVIGAMGEPFGRYAQSPSSIPLVGLISASENNSRPDLTRARVDAEAAGYLFTSPLPAQMVGGAASAYPKDDAFGQLPKRMPRTVVLQGDRDPKTPHDGAVEHVLLLPPPMRLVTVKGGAHFLLLTAPDCVIATTKASVAGRDPEPACAAP